jgi:hypothetical protein
MLQDLKMRLKIYTYEMIKQPLQQNVKFTRPWLEKHKLHAASQ